MFTLEQQAASPIFAENIYHLAYRAPNLVEAMAAMSKSLGATWAEPFEVDGTWDKPGGGTDEAQLRIAYSLQGPPFIELIEHVSGPPDSLFAEPPGGVHHIGVYAERWRDETARLVAAGFIHELNGSGLAFLRDPLTGIRYEVVSFRGRDFLTNILNGNMGRQHPLRTRA
ncbi:MAG: VOC family protein [Caulobacteraceae bacterium]|nr:VOC family protein [Caulobacteraceae bacterium]